MKPLQYVCVLWTSARHSGREAHDPPKESSLRSGPANDCWWKCDYSVARSTRYFLRFDPNQKRK